MIFRAAEMAEYFACDEPFEAADDLPLGLAVCGALADVIEGRLPAPLRPIPVNRNALLPDLGCEHRPEPVPPDAYCLVADIDAVFVEKILDLPQRQREADIHHRRQPDDLG